MISLRIVTPYGLYKETETTILNVTTPIGKEGILPKHVPMVAMLEISTITTVENNIRETYSLAGGILYFEKDKATIITPAIEHTKEIDLDRAEKAKKRAQNRIENFDENTDMKRAELALKRALNRINALRVEN